MIDRNQDIENRLADALLALRHIKNWGTCEYINEPEKDRPVPCACPHCTATRAVDPEASAWRFQGAAPDRLETMTREADIMRAFRKCMCAQNDPDMKLAGILREIEGEGLSRYPRTIPSPRDWFVASSVVQWLATNVGSAVLSDAGFTWNDPRRRGGSDE